MTEMDSKLKNFNKDIISIISIILAIVPLIAINASNASKEYTVKSSLATNGCLILAISTIYFLIGATILDVKNKIWFVLIPIAIGVSMISISIFCL